MEPHDTRTRPTPSGAASGTPSGTPSGAQGGAQGAALLERLAADFIARLAVGEAPAVDAFVAQLPDEGDRGRLRALIEETQRIQGLLPSQVRPGVTLKGRYRLLREIGSGGMGKVFEAVDSQLERRVAVKVLAAIGAESFDPEQLFMQEAVLLASLQHPNIVAVHELGSDGDITFIVMDLVQGAAASDVLLAAAAALQAGGGGRPRSGRLLQDAIGLPLPAGRPSLVDRDSWFRSVARIVLEVTRTIEEAHGRGVIHRDIKPHNILLRGDGSPVILDFGLAGTLDRGPGAITRGLFGTVGYFAPEQAASSRIGTDPRTDVYQLGLLLYEFLTLQRAFSGDQITAVLARICHGEFRRPRAIDRGIPFELEAICLKAMELDPARRYATATALREDLQRWVEGSEPPFAARGGALAAGVRSARYWVRRHKPATAVAVTLAAGCLAVLVALRNAPAAAPADPVVRAYRYSRPSRESVYYPQADTVRPGDILGVTLDAAAPQFVYALSVFGGRDPPSYVAPMRLVAVGAAADISAGGAAGSTAGSAAGSAAGRTGYGQPAAAAGDTWGLRVDPGASVNCTEITEASAADTYEGLWVFTSSEPQPQIEAWMNRLGELAALAPGEAVPFSRAKEAFDAVQGRTRGGPVRLSAEENARVAGSLTAASVLGETDWPFTDPRRTAVFFRVER